MKHGNTFYLELTRELFTEQYRGLSNGAKWLFVVLNELEHRYTNGGADEVFFRSDEELAKDAGMSITTLKRYKKELRETDLIEVTTRHYFNYETGKSSEKQTTYYKVKK